ncbi:MafI family immunity protein [Achromobacter dolens]|uniref:MafI family immunity protein n=1 Tax=Achromobacter dolens TaxID=1287738 RepID=UPI00158399A5|nr:MafI family immunity protein [Achromobacter dolens]
MIVGLFVVVIIRLFNTKIMCDPDKIIIAALEEISMCLCDSTDTNVRELLSSGEAGVALELLCTQLMEFDIYISERLKEQLVLAEKAMEMSIEELQYLKTL